MTRSAIRSCLQGLVGDVAAANGTSAALGGTVRPAVDLAGVTSAQLLSSTAELAFRLGIDIPETENVFVRESRAASMDEITDRLTELARTAPTNGTSP